MPSAAIELSEHERVTLLCALLNYAGLVAHPEDCVSLLDRISPHPTGSWKEAVEEFRSKLRDLREDRSRPDYDPHIDYPERFKEGPI